MLRCRQKDTQLVNLASSQAKQIYETTLKSLVTIKIDDTAYLPEASDGGVILSVLDGRIKLVNTLENRLELLGEKV